MKFSNLRRQELKLIFISIKVTVSMTTYLSSVESVLNPSCFHLLRKNIWNFNENDTALKPVYHI